MLKHFCIIFLILPKTSTKLIWDETTEAHIALADCALLVTKRHISPKTNTIVVNERCKTCRTVIQNVNYRLMDHYLRHIDGTSALQLYLGQKYSQPWNYYVFIVDNLVAFNELGFHIPPTQFEREFYFLIILTHTVGNHHLRRKIMREIFRTCIKLKVLHVVIMLNENEEDDSPGSIVFYTYFLSGHYCSQTIDIQRVNRFHNGTLENDILFPPQLMDFKGCLLNVTAFQNFPMLGFEGDTENAAHVVDLDRLTGIDGSMLWMLSKILNFRIFMHFAEEKGVINLNENSTGCFADLETGKAEIAIGGFTSTYDNRTKFSPSIPYHYSSYVFIVRTNLQYGVFSQFANPFCPVLWLIIGITITLAFAIITAIDFYGSSIVRTFVMGPSNQFPNTNLITIFLGNPVNTLPRRNFARFLFTCWLFLTFLLRNAYQGKLFDSLRSANRLPIPGGITDLINHNFRLISTKPMNIYPENLTLLVPNMLNHFEIIEKNDSRLATILALEMLAYYNYVHSNSSHLSYVPEPVHLQHQAMYFQKHSVLKTPFDSIIRKMQYAGITSYVSKQYEYKRFQSMNIGLRKLPRINNDMLAGIYLINAVLCAVTLIVFILELLTQKVRRLKVIFDFLHR